ncbi:MULTISPECIES: adenylate/guanylate cyclase domain-containing protein [unclassified Rhizobium]|uniref:adenylate/guanylate cyclase domain-containing protein n=1 Tax=unclassified Rhizobium TaxID=2613769 RepID=UPI00160B2F77|nr:MULTISPECIES: adenylate/guanylate cyclase domain-containing protein [unclassified Rhizobium]MBB3542593.1 adenylate cyclase [Rhizobium sp. BK399]MCS3739392.1 adenylate cyclase [Rhizobium sp. BK661]MCS4091425.1 adenylate cyclase [Rhizobium sp. BK176]
MQRKLATIMVGDFVGSTPAMETDEEGAIVRIDAVLDTVRSVVRRHDGRVFGTAGDALLAEFSSPVNALRCAIAARAEIAAMPGSSGGEMRFGLHVADVVVVGTDLRGDGVNIAARIETSAQPGAIEVSGLLYDQVRRVSPCGFEDTGERQLKGIIEPIRVYRVTELVDRHVFQFAPTRSTPNAAQSPRTNSIAVARFDIAPGAVVDQSFLAEGITDDLTLELSRLKGLFVSSRSAATALTTKDPVEIGRLLGVGYVISGSIRQAGDEMRINIQLTETGEGLVIWSDRITRPFRELLDVMDEIIARVAATVSGRVEQSELAAARLKRPENMTAYEYYLRGLDHHRLIGVSDSHIHEAMAWFERSMTTDPGFGRPFGMHVCSWSNLPSFDLQKAEQQVAHALALDPTDPEAHRIMGAIKMKSGDFVSARYHHIRAHELAPNDAYILGRSAAFYVYAGEPERALEMLDRAETLDPFLPVWITEERVAALYALGRFDDMLRVALTLPFQTRRTSLYQIAACMACGNTARAELLVRQALSLDPGLSAVYIRMQETYADTSITETMIQRNCDAGLPLTPRKPAVRKKSLLLR